MITDIVYESWCNETMPYFFINLLGQKIVMLQNCCFLNQNTDKTSRQTASATSVLHSILLDRLLTFC